MAYAVEIVKEGDKGSNLVLFRRVLAGGGRVFMADIDAKQGAAEKDNFVKEYGKVKS